MYNIIIIRNGEIAIKGKNRPIFENELIRQIKYKLKEYIEIKIYRANGRIEIHTNGIEHMKIIDKISNLFGIVSVSPALMIKPGYDNLIAGIDTIFKEVLKKKDKLSFKINIKRKNKNVSMTSMEMNRDIGEYFLDKYPENLNVDVQNPDIEITGEFRRENNIIYYEKISCAGGMPSGINGRAMSLLSGGIDSPVATYMMARRGISINAVHFHSFPYTNERSQEKIKRILDKLKISIGKVTLYMVNILEIQKEVQDKCPSEHMTIISRRFMMRIAEKLALKNNSQMIVTGESLGQVASQTAEGLICTNNVVKNIPVMRPLIATEKSKIIEIAKTIGTYEISIIPEIDSCTVFLPEKTATKPKLEKIINYEKALYIDELVNRAVETSEKIEIY